jgi:hypothetical protein
MTPQDNGSRFTELQIRINDLQKKVHLPGRFKQGQASAASVQLLCYADDEAGSHRLFCRAPGDCIVLA